jgi:hypothetical protein
MVWMIGIGLLLWVAAVFLVVRLFQAAKHQEAARQAALKEQQAKGFSRRRNDRSDEP